MLKNDEGARVVRSNGGTAEGDVGNRAVENELLYKINRQPHFYVLIEVLVQLIDAFFLMESCNTMYF